MNACTKNFKNGITSIIRGRITEYIKNYTFLGWAGNELFTEFSLCFMFRTVWLLRIFLYCMLQAQHFFRALSGWSFLINCKFLCLNKWRSNSTRCDLCHVICSVAVKLETILSINKHSFNRQQDRQCKYNEILRRVTIDVRGEL
jgi:hypothetical protein